MSRDKVLQHSIQGLPKMPGASTRIVSFEQIQHNPDAAALLSFISHVESKAIPHAILSQALLRQRMTEAIGLNGVLRSEYS